MEQNFKNKDYKIEEVLTYYILGFQNYNAEIKEIGKNHWILILKKILELAKAEVDIKGIMQKHKGLLDKVQYSWKLTKNDLVAYATCIFYVLTNREKEITPEKIIKEFLTEIHSHHPRRTLKEANFILNNFFSNRDK